MWNKSKKNPKKPTRDNSGAIHILFVCTGNTCRSPMAEALAKKIYTEAGLDVITYSAGTSASSRHMASSQAITVMKDEEGLDIKQHKSLPISKELIVKSNLVLTMTHAHKDTVVKKYPQYANKIYTLGEYAGVGEEVPDPFGGDIDCYILCAKTIKELLLLSLSNVIKTWDTIGL